MSNLLKQIDPCKGDSVWIRHLGDGCTLRPGTIQGQEGAGFHRATFLGRFVDIRLEPAWDMEWTRGVEYVECVPTPKEGDTVHRRNADGHDWEVWMCMFSLRLDIGQVTFDKFHFVIGRYDASDLFSPRAGFEYARLWVRWCYSGGAFVPVQDPQLIKKLNAELPR